MAWGEPQGPSISARMVARRAYLDAADRLAAAVARWLRNPTTGNADACSAAVDAYIDARAEALA